MIGISWMYTWHSIINGIIRQNVYSCECAVGGLGGGRESRGEVVVVGT